MIKQYLKRFSIFSFYGLLAYVPFHILLSIWIGSNLGLLAYTKTWFNVLLLVGFMATVSSADRQSLLKALKSRLVWLMVGYGSLSLATTLLADNNIRAELLGLAFNTRYV